MSVKLVVDKNITMKNIGKEAEMLLFLSVAKGACRCLLSPGGETRDKVKRL